MLDLVRLRVLAAVARTGSITRAAEELHYSQPTVSHHLSRLEAETGAQLLQRVGRNVRLTPSGRLLAERAVEILGRVDSAAAELSAHEGLNAGKVRLAGFSSAMGTLIPPAAATLAATHPGLELSLTDTHPPEALRLLRAGEVDVAVIFRYDESAPEMDGVRLHHLLDDPTYLLTAEAPATLAARDLTAEAPGSLAERRDVTAEVPGSLAERRDVTAEAPGRGLVAEVPGSLAEHRGSRWIAGCERCRAHLLDLCAREGFRPNIAYSTDDMVVMQSLVGAGLGVTTIPGLALRAHRTPGIQATEVPDATRHVYAATYGDPPDPPATVALLAALRRAA